MISQFGARAAGPTGLTGSNFEILDGNTTVEGALPALDWDSATGTVVDADITSGSTDNSFVQGTKEDTAIPKIETGSIPPNKSDLKQFGSYVEHSAGGNFLHLFWTRVQDPSGTTNMDFEFNHNVCTSTNTSGCTSNGQTPVRSTGDLLITYDLANGGTRATISLRYWNGTAWGAATALDPAVATGSINGTAITTITPGGTFSARTFGEASVNLASIFDSSACKSFGSAYLKSRSSDAFSSALKDFIRPIGVDLSNCGRLVVKKTDSTGAGLEGASFTISPANNATPPVSTMTAVTPSLFCIDSLLLNTTYTVHESVVPPGYNAALDQTFSTTTVGTCGPVGAATTPDLTISNTPVLSVITLHKQDDTGAPAEAGFTLYRDVNPQGGTGPDTGDLANVVATCGAPLASDCTFPNLPLGQYWVVETTTPTGYATAAPQHVTLANATPVALTFVDPRQFKVITLVCQLSTSQLYSSSVSYDSGSSQTTLGHTGPAGADAICSTGGAVLGPVGNGGHSAAITIP